MAIRISQGKLPRMSGGTPVAPGNTAAAGVVPGVGLGLGPAPVTGSEVHSAAGLVIVFVSIVTAPFRARARPMRVALVFMVMLVRAITVP
jgi:hypothetical protein